MTCPFCRLIDAGRVLMESGAAVAIEDAHPVNPGHCLILPRRHEPDFFELSEHEVAAIFRLVPRVRALIATRHRPPAWNLGVNIGEIAGQTVNHAHLHVIPRYPGDVAEPRGGVRWIIPARAPYPRQP